MRKITATGRKTGSSSLTMVAGGGADGHAEDQREAAKKDHCGLGAGGKLSGGGPENDVSPNTVRRLVLADPKAAGTAQDKNARARGIC